MSRTAGSDETSMFNFFPSRQTVLGIIPELMEEPCTIVVVKDDMPARDEENWKEKLPGSSSKKSKGSDDPTLVASTSKINSWCTCQQRHHARFKMIWSHPWWYLINAFLFFWGQCSTCYSTLGRMINQRELSMLVLFPVVWFSPELASHFLFFLRSYVGSPVCFLNCSNNIWFNFRDVVDMHDMVSTLKFGYYYNVKMILKNHKIRVVPTLHLEWFS